MSAKFQPCRSVALAVMLTILGCKQEIAHDLSEPQANRILSELFEASLEAEKVRQSDGRWSIAVESSVAAPALKHAYNARLVKEREPEPQPSGFLDSGKGGMAYLENLKSRQLEATITSIEGVLEAKVHLNMPAKGHLLLDDEPAQEPTAGVLVLKKSKAELNEGDISAVVSGATGIEPSRILVVVRDIDMDALAASLRIEISLPNRQRYGSYIAPAIAVALAGALLLFRRKKAPLERLKAC